MDRSHTPSSRFPDEENVGLPSAITISFESMAALPGRSPKKPEQSFDTDQIATAFRYFVYERLWLPALARYHSRPHAAEAHWNHGSSERPLRGSLFSGTLSRGTGSLEVDGRFTSI